MSITAAQLIAKVSVDGADKAKSDLQGVGGAVTSAGSIFKSALGGGLSLAAGLAGKAFSFLKDQLEDSVKIAMAHQDVMAQTAQAIKSTGDASGLSATQIGDMATALSKTTKFSEDTVQSGENLLLTFTGIGKDVFPLATNAMVDLSQAMGQDMKSSAIQLGKALNDPLTGMSALQRVGVTFSDSEKEQIKTMMAHNDIIGAQKVMLAELNKEFGGSAQAAGKTLSGALAILKNNFDDLKEKVGSAVIPIFANLVGMINSNVMPLFDKLGPVIGSVVSYFKSFDLTPITYAFHQLVTVVKDLLDPLGKGKVDLSALSPILTTLKNDFSQLMVSGIRDVGHFIQFIADRIGNISNGQGPAAIAGMTNAFKQFAPLIQNVASLMGNELLRELRDVGAAAQQFGQWFMTSVVPAIRQAMPGFESLAKTILTTVIPALIQIRGVVVDVIEHAFKVFGPIVEQTVPPLIKLAGQIATGLTPAIKFLTPYVLQAMTAIGQFADQIIDRIAPIIKNWIAQMTSDLTTFQRGWAVVWPYLSHILAGVWNEIVGTVRIAWSILTGMIKVGLDLLSGNWSGAWDDLKDMLGGVWGGIQQVVSGGLQALNGLFAGLPGQLLVWGEDAIQGFIQGIENMVGGVGQAASQVAGAVASVLHFSKPDIGPLASVDTWMPDFGDLLSKGLVANIPKIKASVAQLALPISATLSPGSSSFAGSGVSSLQFPAMSAPVPASPASQRQVNLQIDGMTFARLFMPYFVQQAQYGVGLRM